MNKLQDIVMGSVDQSTLLTVLDAATGVPDQSLIHTDFGLWYRLETQGTDTRLAVVGTGSITEQTQTVTGAHQDWGIVHLEEGVYRVDLHDDVVAYGAEAFIVGAVITDKVVVPAYHKLIYPVGIIHGTVDTGGTHTLLKCFTTVDGYSADQLINGVIVFTGGTASGCRAKITDYVATNGEILFSGGIATVPVNGDRFVIV